MAKLVWDATGERRYETGVDQGVLYIPNQQGQYSDGVAWNGLTTVTESPSGAESNPQYADNIKYLNLISAEEFGCTIEAFTYPDEFMQFDGVIEPEPGVSIGQQSRRTFGFCYRTKLGNDVDGDDLGYKLHLVYGAQAAPSEKAYNTINDSPEAITFSWEVTTTPVAVSGLKPTAILTVDSTRVSKTSLEALEDALYGTQGSNPRLPLPDEVIGMFAGDVQEVTPVVPTFNGTDTITIPEVTGVQYFIANVPVDDGAHEIEEDVIVRAQPKPGYRFPDVVDDDWYFEYSD